VARADAPRRIDRQRRSRIIDGAIAVLAEHGVQGLRHRRVAEAAGVPLAATTYYFASLDDLLVAAMARATEQDVAALTERFDALGEDGDVAGALAEIVVEATGRGREAAVVVSELYTAALRNPALRDAVVAWDDSWAATLAPHMGERTARAMGMVVGGLIQGALIHGLQPDLDETRALFASLL
jgi:DNA-binding transcriptional regulator YbjK